MAEGTRSFVAGNFAWQIDGIDCGLLKSVSGGGITADVVEEPVAADYLVKKHIAGIKYEDFSVECGISMAGKPLGDWIKSTLQRNVQRKDGAIFALDYTLKTRQIRDWKQAILTEIGFPKVDGGSKDPMYLTLKFAPESVRNMKGDNKEMKNAVDVKQKKFLAQNFRFEIDGLPAGRVNTVDAITIKQTAVEDAIGEKRFQEKIPGKLTIPNIKVTLSEVDSEPWYKWHEDFVINGNNSDDKEKNAALILLDPTLQELARVTFKHVGIFKIDSTPVKNNDEQVKRVTAEMYVEEVDFEWK